MKNISKIIFVIIMMLFLLTICTKIHATDQNIDNSINSTIVSKEDFLKAYDEFTEKYSKEDLKNMIEENKDEIMKELKIDEQTFKTGTELIVSFDRKELRKIIVEDLNIEEIQQKVNKGYSTEQIINDIQAKMSTFKKLSVITKILLANTIINNIITMSLAFTIYITALRWIIFVKAKRHGWASIIPIYKEVTYLKVSNISPWWILILLIPVFGWLIYVIIKLISRFTLAKSFNRGVGFGFGLWLLPIIFESILAFNKKIKYSK